MDTKTLRGVEIKDESKGEVTAVFATLGVRDHDGDFTRDGAFTDGAPVRISAYGHKSWDGLLPVGKGVIRIKGKKAILEGQFFMSTTHGRDTFETVKELSEAGLQEWSYGFDINEYSFGEEKGQQVRYLDRVTVHEVSPVLLGAGIGTRTLSAKGRSADVDSDADDGGSLRSVAGVPAVKRGIPRHETEVVSRSWDATGTVAALPEDARPSQLRTVYAWVDPDGDPEAKSNYKFPHHHGVGGPANIRACIAGIAALNGARGGADIPEADRESVYKHLAAHLMDADREPPELRAAPGGARKNLRFGDEAADVMASVSGLIDRATEVMALRARKGRGMSPVTADLLSWIGDDLKRLQRLLEHPIEDDQSTVSEDEIASTLMAAVARVNGI
ncbi:HK97 family phage prohead protease [Streptomyces sp. HNM0645]|uniref:HK97 family phage prohead protease n=1 Tax=Streptomyces sp. HNM0645 TaxID=2782343 RepID=UPI0024B73FB6|nr:HK97 family phage prohead protease [Streptomyces sp. HNM0645]MDI9885910.1 HK97 family phage prohead protease [Streptomyces sp. HNM0645]